MRIVIKLGTRLLTRRAGELDRDNISRLSLEIGALLDAGHECLIVSSGAVGAGCGRLGCSPGELSIRQKQAAASVGQTDLMNIYREAFSLQGRMVGQILVTAMDFARRGSYLNIRNTLNTLLELNIVPIINENDTVAVEELKFGDNDRIAGIITVKVDADKLVILTDVEGLNDPSGTLVKEVSGITPEIEAYAAGRGSEYSSGGMTTKIEAAKMVSRLCGINTYLADGRRCGVLSEIVSGGNPGTVFIGGESAIPHRKRWIAGLAPSGKLSLDAGAVSAVLNRNTSLLAVGITEVSGRFSEGDPVSCLDGNGRIFAIGLVNFSSDDIKKIAGQKSSCIKEITGRGECGEVIGRDNLVLV